MKKILFLFCFVLQVLAMPGSLLPDIEAANPNPDAYENYLTIKYHLHLYEFHKAEALIDQYLEKHPDDPFILTEKAFLVEHLRNDRQRALKLLEKSKSVYPDYFYSNFLQASVLYEQYNEVRETPSETKTDNPRHLLDEAITCLETAIKDNKDYYDSYFLAGVILNDKGEYAKSNGYFEQANRIKQSTASYLYMASNYKHLNDPARVITSYKKILSFSPSNFSALTGLSEIYQEQKDFKNSSIYLEKLFQRYPENKKITFEYLYSLFASGENKKFLEASNKVDIKDSALLMHAKALILTQEKRFDEAKKLLKNVEKQDFSSHMLLTEVYLHKQDIYLAYQTLEKIDTKDRNYLYYSLQLHVLAMMDMNRRIAEIYNLVKKDKSVPEKLTVNDYYNILHAYVNLDRLDDVREVTHFVKERLKNDPQMEKITELIQVLENFSLDKELDVLGMKHENNIFLLLNYYKKRKRYGMLAAILKKMLEKVESKSREEEQLNLELCDIYLEKEQFDRAENLLKILRKKFPASTIVKNYYAYFLARQKKNLDHALELSAGTLVADEGNPAYLDTYGYILFRMGRSSEAITFLEKAYEKYPFDPEIMDHLADYYRLKKQNDKIIEIYKKAIDSGVDFKDRLIEKIEELKNASKPKTP